MKTDLASDSSLLFVYASISHRFGNKNDKKENGVGSFDPMYSVKKDDGSRVLALR